MVRLVSDQSLLIGLCLQDYKSLCAVAAIYATLINIQMHTDRQTAFWPAYQLAELKTCFT